MNTNHAIVVLVAVLVVGGVPSALAANTGGPSAATPTDAGIAQSDVVHAQDNETTEENETAEETEIVEGQNQTADDSNLTNITFSDQTSNGSAVVVDRVGIGSTKPPGGFVVIHLAENETEDEMNVTEDEMNKTEEVTQNETENVTEDMLGEQIGNSTFLESGEQQNVTVELNQTLEENQTLIAVLYQDSQSDEQFDPEGDQPFEVDDELVADTAMVNVSEMADIETPVEGEETPTEDDEAE